MAVFALALVLMATAAAGCSDPCETGGDNTIPGERQLAANGDAVVVVDSLTLADAYRTSQSRGSYSVRHATGIVAQIVYLDSRLREVVVDQAPVAGQPVQIAVPNECPAAGGRVGEPGDTLVLFLMWTGHPDLPDWEAPWLLYAAFILEPDQSLRHVGDPTDGLYLDEAVAGISRLEGQAPLDALSDWLAETRGAPGFDLRLP